MTRRCELMILTTFNLTRMTIDSVTAPRRDDIRGEIGQTQGNILVYHDTGSSDYLTSE